MPTDYYKTKASVDQYIELAKDVNGNDLIKKLKRFLSPDSTLLEIGTGPGSDWSILIEDYEAVGSDNSIEFLNHLTSTYPAGRFIELDATTLLTNQLFDGIYSNKVMHHLNDEALAASILRQYEILNNEGIICHSFWKGEGSEIFKGLFVKYHSEDSLRACFEQYFEISLIESYAEFESGDSLLLIGKKK